MRRYPSAVTEDAQADDIAADCVNVPDQPAERNVVHDRLHALEGVLRIGNIVNEKKNAADELNGKQHEQHGAQGVPCVDSAREQVFREIVVQEVPEAEPHIQVIHNFSPAGHSASSTDDELVLPDLYRIRRKRPGRRSAEHLSFRRKPSRVTGAKKDLLSGPPLDYAAQVGADG